MFGTEELKKREWFLIVIYFFFNTVFLPHGLLYTTLLTPLFMYSLYQRNIYKYIYWYPLALLPFFIQHLTNGIELYYYVKSTVLMFTVVVFCVFVYHWAKDFQAWDKVMRRLVYWNAVFLVFAIIAYQTPQYAHKWWWIRGISSGIEGVSRLKLLTYEASYYSLLLVPVFSYFIVSSVMSDWWKKNIIPVLILMVLLVLSFSLGVIGGLIIALSIVLTVLLYNKIGLKKFTLLGVGVIALLIGAIWLVTELYPHSMLVTRLNNVLSGKDTSFNGRTSDSFFLADVLLGMKNKFWGIGFGQIKVLGLELWRSFYMHPYKLEEVAIPNAAAETFAIFGYLGLILRILVQLTLFFTTKVYKNAFRLSLFLFIFIYQFTGSYIFSIAEYMIWILAFVPNFKDFDFINIRKKNENTLPV
jgi:hypothetical protein